MAALERLTQLLDERFGVGGGRVRVVPRHDKASSGVQVKQGKSYRAGYDDEAVEDFAVEDGRASLPDPSTWGENTTLQVIRILVAACEGLAHLVGHSYRQESLPVEKEIEDGVPVTEEAEQKALDDIEEEADAHRESHGLTQRIRNAGLVLPNMADIRRYVVKLFALVAGDMAFIAVCFQVFGLSDRLLLGFLPWSSELQMAAFSSVLALLFLAHHAGEDVVRLSHHNHGRRKAGAEAEPRLGAVAYVSPAVWVLGAVLVLAGIAAVREAYLVEKGTDAHTWVFVAIQAGVFLAALALSMSHSHPFAREWARVSKRLGAAAARSRRSAQAHARLVGRVNGLIDEREALLAMAVQHVRVGEADVPRQVALYLRRVQLSLPEPIHERLFPTDLPVPTDITEKALKGILEGPGETRTFERPSVDRVVQRREELRNETKALRASAEEVQQTVLAKASNGKARKSAPTNGGGGS